MEFFFSGIGEVLRSLHQGKITGWTEPNDESLHFQVLNRSVGAACCARLHSYGDRARAVFSCFGLYDVHGDSPPAVLGTHPQLPP